MVKRGFPEEKTSELRRRRNGAPGRKPGTDRLGRESPWSVLGKNWNLGWLGFRALEGTEGDET